VVGRDGFGCAEVFAALISRFDLEIDVLGLRRAAPNTFIALLPTWSWLIVFPLKPGSDHLLCIPAQRSPKKKSGPVQTSRPGLTVSQEACGDDWIVVESRRSKRQRLKLERQRAVSLDLVGRCFNCLAQGHFAFQCLKRTRCFRCRELGHRSYKCVRAKAPVWQRISTAGSSSGCGDLSRPESQGSVWRRISPSSDASASARCGGGIPRPEARASVWRRITPPAFRPELKLLPSTKSSRQMWKRITHRPSSGVDASGDSPSHASGKEAAGCISSAPLPVGVGVRPKRKRVRKRRSRANPSGAPPPYSSDRPVCMAATAALVAPVHHVPPCILGWSHHMTRADDDLQYAVMVTAISDRSSVRVSEIVDLLAPRLEMEASSLVLRRVSASNYLLVLPCRDKVEELAGRWATLRAGSFSVVCKKWSRLMESRGALLPVLINVELQGIPIHAWETSTVDHLLNPFAWIHQVHPDTLNLKNVAVFRCSAWCLDPSVIPPSKELWIVEPPFAVEGDPVGKRVLVYSVNIAVSITLRQDGSGPVLRSEDADDEDHSPRRTVEGVSSCLPMSLFRGIMIGVRDRSVVQFTTG
jgi:hypothetical protein